jgi:hypothetical protein
VDADRASANAEVDDDQTRLALQIRNADSLTIPLREV